MRWSISKAHTPSLDDAVRQANAGPHGLHIPIYRSPKRLTLGRRGAPPGIRIRDSRRGANTRFPLPQAASEIGQPGRVSLVGSVVFGLSGVGIQVKELVHGVVSVGDQLVRRRQKDAAAIRWDFHNHQGRRGRP